MPQMVVAAALVPADAILDIDQFGLPDHIEAPGTTECLVHHGHLFCQIVRSLWATGAAPDISIAGEHAPPLYVAQPRPDASLTNNASIWSAPAIPRAPPHV
ncbi:MAG: hypothetical protein OXU74_02445 [Gemmatimonadota bacterium]|nr:hypothetical protein [Gemmatimonadota bacterium]